MDDYEYELLWPNFNPCGFNALQIEKHIDSLNDLEYKFEYIETYRKVLEEIYKSKEKYEIKQTNERTEFVSDRKYIDVFCKQITLHLQKNNEKKTEANYLKYYTKIYDEILPKIENLLNIKYRYLEEIKKLEIYSIKTEENKIETALNLVDEETKELQLYDYSSSILPKLKKMINISDKLIYLEEIEHELNELIEPIQYTIDERSNFYYHVSSREYPEYNKDMYRWHFLTGSLRSVQSELKRIKEKILFKNKLEILLGENNVDKELWTGSKGEFGMYVNKEYDNNNGQYSDLKDASDQLFDKFQFRFSWDKVKCYETVKKR